MPRISKVVPHKLLEYLLKTAMVFAIIAYLIEKGGEKTFWEVSWFVPGEMVGVVGLVTLLGLLNWAIEAKKWQIIVRPVAEISFFNSLRGVLSGKAYASVIPLGLGDCLGRLSFAETDRKIEGASLLYLGGLIQFFVTFFFGLYGLSFLTSHLSVELTEFLWLIIGAATGIVVLVLRNWIPKFLRESVGRIRLAVRSLNGGRLLNIVLLSILRYLTFTTQLIILFYAVGVDLPFEIIAAGVTWIFFSKTVVPTFNLIGDIGIREASALLFFSLFGVASSLVIFPTLLLWFINICLPVLFGVVFLFGGKLIKPDYSTSR